MDRSVRPRKSMRIGGGAVSHNTAHSRGSFVSRTRANSIASAVSRRSGGNRVHVLQEDVSQQLVEVQPEESWPMRSGSSCRRHGNREFAISSCFITLPIFRTLRLRVRGRLRVLLVEDSVTIQRMMKRWFEMKGCVVQVAADGRQGLHLLQSKSYDLVLTDFIMVRLGWEDPLHNSHRSVTSLILNEGEYLCTSWPSRH